MLFMTSLLYVNKFLYGYPDLKKRFKFVWKCDNYAFMKSAEWYMKTMNGCLLNTVLMKLNNTYVKV